MEVFAVQTYFSTEFLAFFETLLQIRRPVLVGTELVQDSSFRVARRPSTSPTTQADASCGGGSPGHSNNRSSDAAEGVGNPSPVAGAGQGDDAGPRISGRRGRGNRRRGQFDQLRVSAKFRGMEYKALAQELITHGAMPLGLYRPAGTKGSTLAYTHVNPSVSEPLVDGDIVFVLRSRSCTLLGSI